MNLLYPHRSAAVDHRCAPATWLGIAAALAVLTGVPDTRADQWVSDRLAEAVWIQPVELPPDRHPATTPFSPARDLVAALRDGPEPGMIPAGSLLTPAGAIQPVGQSDDALGQTLPTWPDRVSAGYDGGLFFASGDDVSLAASEAAFLMRLRAYAQLRYTNFDSETTATDLNQFQLIRGRIIVWGHAFAPTLRYAVQFHGGSSTRDEIRVVDYYLNFDLGRHYWGWAEDALVFKAGQYKVAFTMARELSARLLEFSDRSMASMYFDANRSQAWGLLSRTEPWGFPLQFETAVFNGLSTAGTETGGEGQLDDRFAYAARLTAYPLGEWGRGQLADFDRHAELALRIGGGVTATTIQRIGPAEFDQVRVVDSGQQLSALLPATVEQYALQMYCADASFKYRGWSVCGEYYFRDINDFRGASVPALFDHGFWLQTGKFLIPEKMQLLSRWSRVVGRSGTLGAAAQSADEIGLGLVWYFRGEDVRFTTDLTHINGAPLRSQMLDMFPGDAGWLLRSQIQFGF